MLTGVAGRTGLRSVRVTRGVQGARRTRGSAGPVAAQAGVGGRARGRAGGAVRALAEPVADQRAQLRRGVEHPAGAGDAAREPAAARLVDLGRLLLHDRAARVRAGGRRPGAVAGRGAHLRRADLHAHGGAGGAARPGPRDRRGRAAPGRDRGRDHARAVHPRRHRGLPREPRPLRHLGPGPARAAAARLGGRSRRGDSRRAGTSRSRSARCWPGPRSATSCPWRRPRSRSRPSARSASRSPRPAPSPGRAALGRAAGGGRADLGRDRHVAERALRSSRRLRPAAGPRHQARLARAAPGNARVLYQSILLLFGANNPGKPNAALTISQHVPLVFSSDLHVIGVLAAGAGLVAGIAAGFFGPAGPAGPAGRPRTGPTGTGSTRSSWSRSSSPSRPACSARCCSRSPARMRSRSCCRLARCWPPARCRRWPGRWPAARPGGLAGAASPAPPACGRGHRGHCGAGGVARRRRGRGGLRRDLAALPGAGAEVAAWLVAHHQRDGLAAYWQGTQTTVTSGGRVLVAPVTAAGNAAKHWEASSAWYQPSRHRATFVIAEPIRPTRRTRSRSRPPGPASAGLPPSTAWAATSS